MSFLSQLGPDFFCCWPILVLPICKVFLCHQPTRIHDSCLSRKCQIPSPGFLCHVWFHVVPLGSTWGRGRSTMAGQQSVIDHYPMQMPVFHFPPVVCLNAQEKRERFLGPLTDDSEEFDTGYLCVGHMLWLEVGADRGTRFLVC